MVLVTTAALSPFLMLSGPGIEFVSHEHLSGDVQVSGEQGCLGSSHRGADSGLPKLAGEPRELAGSPQEALGEPADLGRTGPFRAHWLLSSFCAEKSPVTCFFLSLLGEATEEGQLAFQGPSRCPQTR